MEEMNLDIASEYLVMAAELIEMKSNSQCQQFNFDRWILVDKYN